MRQVELGAVLDTRDLAIGEDVADIGGDLGAERGGEPLGLQPVHPIENRVPAGGP